MSDREVDDYELDGVLMNRKPSISRKIYRSHAEYAAAERAARHSKELAARRQSPPSRSPESPLMAAPLIVGVVDPSRHSPEREPRITSFDLLDLGASLGPTQPRSISSTNRTRLVRNQSHRGPNRVNIGQARINRTSLQEDDSETSASSGSIDDSSIEATIPALQPLARRRVRSSDLQDIIAMSPREDIEALMQLDLRFASSELPTTSHRRSSPPASRRSPIALTDTEGAADNEFPSASRSGRSKYFDTSVKRANFSATKIPQQRSVSVAVPPLAAYAESSTPQASASTAEVSTRASSSTLRRSESMAPSVSAGYEIPRASVPAKHTRQTSKDSSSSDEGYVAVMASPRDVELVTELREGQEFVVAGTAEQLVNHYIYHMQDSTSIRQFILAKGTFLSALELLTMLLRLFESPDEQLASSDRTQLQIRTINFLKKWLSILPEDFEDEAVADSMNAFLGRLVGANETKTWSNIVTTTWATAEAALKRRRQILRGHDLDTGKLDLPPRILKMEALYAAEGGQTSSTSSEHSRVWVAFDIFDLSAEEMARQLTIIDQRKFAKVPLCELFDQRWERPADSPHVDVMNKHFNKVGRWAGSLVLKEYTPKKRAKVIAFLVQIGDHMVQLRNFFGATAIAVGLSQIPISRLTATWEKVSSSAMDKWKRLAGLVNPVGNFRLLRSLQEQRSNSPTLIAPTVLFRDLFFIQEGNEDYFNRANKVLNFEKIMLYGKVLDLFYHAKAMPYSFRHIKVCQKYISHFFCLSDDEMLRVSKTFESSSK
jgi:hypothetical protein